MNRLSRTRARRQPGVTAASTRHPVGLDDRVELAAEAVSLYELGRLDADCYATDGDESWAIFTRQTLLDDLARGGAPRTADDQRRVALRAWAMLSALPDGQRALLEGQFRHIVGMGSALERRYTRLCTATSDLMAVGGERLVAALLRAL